MESNNIEELIKTTIKERSIEPSVEARARLIETLNSKPKKKKIMYLRYAIAVSIVLALFIAGSNLVGKNKNGENPVKVIAEEDSTIAKPQKILVPKSLKEDIVADGLIDLNKSIDNASQSKTTSEVHDVISHESIEKRNNELNKQDNLEVLKSSKNIKLIKNEKTNKTPVAELNAIKIKASEHYTYITPESLLASIQTDSSPQLITTTKSKPKTYVQPDALLVEMERQLFDEKNTGIFKKARRKLKKIKEAVANRNYEQ